MSDIFITENFLLQSDQAIELYHRFAENMPIIDYHCHLPPREIAEDRRFENLTQIWLAGDHYKWRAMRTAGVAERFFTGDASDWEKFQKWAETVPANAPQSALSLDAPGTEAAVRHQRPALGPGNGRGHLGRVQREAGAAGILLPRHHAADERGAGLHDRRSDRHAGTSRGDRRRHVVSDPGVAHLSARQGDGRGISRGLQRLGRPAGRGQRHRHQGRFHAIPRRLAQPARLLP